MARCTCTCIHVITCTCIILLYENQVYNAKSMHIIIIIILEKNIAIYTYILVVQPQQTEKGISIIKNVDLFMFGALECPFGLVQHRNANVWFR